jgi:hypothetical protein
MTSQNIDLSSWETLYNPKFSASWFLCLSPAFTLACCSVYLFLMMEAICFSETSVDFQRITRCYISDHQKYSAVSILAGSRCSFLPPYLSLWRKNIWKRIGLLIGSRRYPYFEGTEPSVLSDVISHSCVLKTKEIASSSLAALGPSFALFTSLSLSLAKMILRDGRLYIFVPSPCTCCSPLQTSGKLSTGF